MSVLLDTNVLSEMVKPKPDAKVVAYLSQAPVAHISVLTLHELTHGAELVKEPGKRSKLSAWVKSIRETYDSNILPVTADIAETAAHLRASASRKGRVLHIEDALIAATAIEHKLSLITRNTSDFEPANLVLINPWKQ